MTYRTQFYRSVKTRQEDKSPLPQLNRNSAEGVLTSQQLKTRQERRYDMEYVGATYVQLSRVSNPKGS